MANFNIAYDITLKNEGGYVNDPIDPGGETYKGISRVYNPNWEGWGIIDQHKFSSAFPKSLYDDSNLNKTVRNFYKKAYWDINKLDYFSSQIIANEMFDTGVNIGVIIAAKFLQHALNLLNRRGKSWGNIPEDGKIGPTTLQIFQTCLSMSGEEILFKFLNVMQGSYYIDKMTENEKKEKYAYGWFERVDFVKKGII